MLADVRQECNLPSAYGVAGDSEITKYLNRAKDLVCQKIIEADQNYFETSDTIDLVAGQEEYDIPRHFKDQKITLVERLRADGTIVRRLSYIRFQDKERYSTSQVSTEDVGQVYFIRGRKVGIRPAPTASQAAGLKVYGIQFPHDLYYGTFEAAGADLTTTTFKMAASGSKLLAGRLSTESNYYKNAIIRVLTGTVAKGLERTITAFAPATQYATIDTAWTVADVDSKNFVILSTMPEQYHPLMVAYANVKVAKKKKDAALLEMAKEEFKELYGSLIVTIDPRHFDENDHIQPPVDSWMDE